MKASFHHLTEAEQTAWLLIVVLLALVLVFAFLFTARIAGELPQQLYPALQTLSIAS